MANSNASDLRKQRPRFQPRSLSETLRPTKNADLTKQIVEFSQRQVDQHALSCHVGKFWFVCQNFLIACRH